MTCEKKLPTSPTLALGAILSAWLGLTACQQARPPETRQSPPTQAKLESRLTLNQATLEQSNAQGQVLWKIQVQEVVYSPDQKEAQLKEVKGNLFQDGKIVLKVSARGGEIERDGEHVFLKENIIAVDPRNKILIRADEVEWRPQEALLWIRKNLRGSHPQLAASAREGKYHTRQQRLELIGNIQAVAEKPRLQLRTERMDWEIPQQKLLGDRPLTLTRYQGQLVTDRLLANRAEVRLDRKQVSIEKAIEYQSLIPPVQVAAEALTWNYRERTIEADRPIQLIHQGEQVTLTGNRGKVSFNDKIAHLDGGVRASNNRTQAKLYGERVNWNMEEQTVEATGDVVYEQPQPKFNLTGDRAVGTLHNNNVTVTSQSRDRVVTEIFPD